MSTVNPSPDDLLTTEEVAQIFRVPVATIRKWRNDRTGPPGFRVGKYSKIGPGCGFILVGPRMPCPRSGATCGVSP